MKQIGIENLLRWAYVDELPKAAPESWVPSGFGSGWGAVGSFVALLAAIDENRYGVVPNLADLGEPHPDAVAVHDAVIALDGLAFDHFEQEDLIRDMAHLGRPVSAVLAAAIDRATWVDADGDRWLMGGVGTMVRTRAILGAPNLPIGEVPKLIPLIGPNGRPVWRRRVKSASAWNDAGDVVAWRDVEVDVHGAKGRLPRDAYQATMLKPDPTALIADRLRWLVWLAGLAALVDLLDGRLIDHVVVPAARPSCPWGGTTGREPRVLKVAGWASAVDPAGPRRPVATRGPSVARSQRGREENPQDA